MTASTLIFGWGNPSRGDDALGPLFIERFQLLAAENPAWGEIEFLTDFQLQVEHALDLRDRRRVLFVDASIDTPAPFKATLVMPARDTSFTSHAMTPQALLHTWCQIDQQAPPPTWLLAIRGESFELGAEPGAAALENLAAALCWAENWVKNELP